MSTKKSYLIDLQVTGATTAQGALNGVERNLKGIAKEAAMMGAAYFSAQGVISALQASVRGAIEAEKAERQLQFAVGGSIKYYQEFAAKIQRTTIYEDDLVVAQMAFLSSLKFTRPEIERMITVATDLAAVTGQDLAGAVETLAKTYSGVTREVSKYFPEIKKLTPEELAMGGAVAIVAKGLRGQAEALAATDYGKLQQAANTWGNLGEDLGKLLLPALTGVTKAALQAVDDVKQAGSFWNEFWGFSDSTTDSVAAAARLSEIAKKRKADAAEAGKFRFAPEGPTTEQIAAQEKARADAAARDKQLAADALQFQTGIWQAMADGQAAHLVQIEADGQAEVDISNGRVVSMEEEFGSTNRLTDAQKKAAAAAELLKQKRDALINGTAAMLGSFSQLNAAAKGNALVTKRLAQGEALINTWAGATRAYRDLPFPLSAIVAATVIAQGLANVAQINAQQFADGGWVRGQGGSRSDTVPARLSDGERVLSAREIALMGGRGAVDAIAAGRGGGGLVINFHGAITDRQFVQDVIVPEIRRAVRVGA